MDIHDIVLKVVCAQLDLKPDEISLDDELIDDLAADSLDIVEIEMSLEDEFKIDNGYDCENWFNNKVTFGQLVKYVEDRLKVLTT